MNSILKLSTLLLILLITHNVSGQIVSGISVNGVIKGPFDTLRVCRGNSITYAYAATNAVTANWIFEGGTPGTSNTTTLQNVLYSTNGVFKTKQTVTNGNLIDSTYTNVVVTDTKPIVDFNFAPDNQCANVPVNFTNLTTGAVSYVWKFGDGTPNQTTTNTVHQFLSAVGASGTQTFNVTLVATNSVGCVDSITKTVTVQRTPDANLGNADASVIFGIFNGIPTFRRCANAPSYNFSFVNASTTIGSITQYQINWGDGSPDSIFPTWSAGVPISHNYPIGNTTLTLSVTGSSGCVGIRQFNFFLGSTPAGGISSPGNTAVCAPQALTFYLNNVSSNPLGTLYSINFSDGTPGLNFNHPPPDSVNHLFYQSSCGFNANAYNNSFSANLVIQNPCGSTSGSVVPIYISSKPRSLITISPDTNVCVNVPVTIAQMPLPGGGFIEFTGGTNSICDANSKFVWTIAPSTGWTVNGGALGNTNGQSNFFLWTNGTQAFSVTFNQPGFYDVTLLIANQCGIDTVKRRICVRMPPVSDFTMSDVSGCVPAFITTTNTSTPNPATCLQNAYLWNITKSDPLNCQTGISSNFIFTNGTNANSFQPSFQFLQPGKYAIQLTTRANSPFNVCPISVKTDTFTVKGPPKVAINPISNICTNYFINPTANVSNCYADSVPRYNWTFTNGTPATSTATNPGPITYNNVATNPILLSVSNECGNTVANTSFQTTALPVANAGIDRVICTDVSTTIGINTGNYTYSWSPSTGLNNVNIANPTVTLSYNGIANDTTYQYIVNVSGGANCDTKDTVFVTVKKRPDIIISPTSASFCVGDSVKLYATSADNYTWSPLTNLVPISNDTVWVKPTVTTTYSVHGSLNVTGCYDTTNIVITVKPYPITNAGFDTIVCISANSVTLSGTPTGGIWSGTQITTGGNFNPNAAGVGTYQQYYTYDLNGCSRTDTLLATVIVNPVANAGNDTTICANTGSLNLTASPIGGTWSGSALVSSGGVFNTNTPGTYNLTYSFGGGTCAAADVKQIIVQPGIGNNTINSNQAICSGQTPSIISGSTPSGGNGSYFYQWQESNDNVSWSNIGGANSINFNPPALTQPRYFRRLVSTNLCQNQASLPIQITINPDARALFNPLQLIGCAPFNITNTNINPSHFPLQNSTYQWYANNTLIGTNSTGSFPGYTITSPNDSITIKLVAISAFGCRNDSMSVKFYTEDRPIASFTKNIDTACGPVTVNFNNTSSNLNYFNYSWNFGNGVISNLAQPGSIVFQPSPNATDTTYIITLKSFKNCDTSTFIRTIRVKSKPRALFLPDKTEGCSPMVVTFNNFSIGNQTSYTWNFGDGSPTITGQAPVTHIYNSGVRDTFYCQLTVTNECGTDTLRYPIIVNPNNIFLDFAVNAFDKFGCAPHTVRFYNNSSGANSYTYNFGDGSNNVTSIRGIDTIVHTYNNPGVYQISLYGINSCTDTTDYETVTVYIGPNSSFTAMPSPACINDTIFFTNTSTPDNISYQWSFGDNTGSNLKNPRKVYGTSGTYSVSLVTSIPYPSGLVCRDTSTTATIVIVDTLQGSFTHTPLNGNCAPFQVKVKNTTLGNPSTQWNFGDGSAIVTGDSATHLYTLPGTYILTMITTSAGGCKFKDTKTVTVAGAYGSMSFAPQNICIGQSVNFTAVSNNASNYIFVFGDGDSTSTNSNIITHTYIRPGKYIPYIYFENGAGCRIVRKYTDTVSVDSVYAHFGIQIQQICGSTTVQFIDSSYSYLGLNSFTWQLANGATANTQNASQIYTSPISFNAVHTVTGLYGCSKTVSKPVAVTVISKPSVSVLAPPGACVGIPLTLVANVISNDPIATYDWNLGNSTFATTPTAVVTYSAPGNYTIRLITTTIYNCADTQYVPIVIAPTPFINAGLDKTICSGQSVVLNTISNGVGSYNWTPTSGLSCTSCPSPIASPLTSTNYVVTLSNGVGCSKTDTVLVAVVNKQFVTLSNNDTICIGQSVQLQATGADKYQWSPTATLSNPLVSNPVATPSSTTTYIVVGRDSLNCFTDTARAIITVSNYPVINVGPDTTLATGSLYNIPFTGSFGPFTSYNWTASPDLSCITCPRPILTASSDKCYAIEATNIYGCTGKDTLCVKTFCDENQLFIPNAFSPDNDGVNDVFYLKSKGISQIKSIRIYNRWGQKVFEKVNVPTNTPSAGWDGKFGGKLLGPEVFVYMIEAVCSNGKLYTYKGDVAILK